MKTTECRGCGQQIAFIQTKAGKWLPIDPEAVHANDCNEGDKLVGDDGVLFTVTAESDESDDYGYVPHWVTCPKADEFRKGK